MLRARYVILSFLCLFAFATQAQANYAFTHSDHLGSASWITDDAAHPVQYIHYAPYGELVANQQATGSTYDERYKFTGKERDAESGYDYFGARFLAHQLGIWTSPDPLLDLERRHYNVEFDNDASRCLEHQQVIEQNDPNSQTILIILD